MFIQNPYSRSFNMAYQSELSPKNKAARLLWGIVQSTLFRWAPRPFHGWRRFWLILFGARVDKSSKVYGSIRVWAPWNVSIGRNAILGDRVDIYSVAPISIGEGAVVSQDSTLCGATHDFRTEAFTLVPKPIFIGQGAWIAARAFIGPGVTVGARSVVGACSVVFKDVPPENIAIGNPAIFKKK